MPSKSNSKGSGAKSQAKPVSKDAAKAVTTGQDVGSSVAASSQSNKVPATTASEQAPRGPAAQEADSIRQNSNGNVTQAVVDEQASVNRKKQKRRMKEAAKKAAEQNEQVGDILQSNFANHIHQCPIKQMPAYNGQGDANGYDYEASDYDDNDRYEQDEEGDMYYTDEAAQPKHSVDYRTIPPHLNGHGSQTQGSEGAQGSKSKKKKKKNKSSSAGLPASNAAPIHYNNTLQRPPPPPPPPVGSSYTSAAPQHSNHVQKDSKIWNTSTAEERERIKEFWLSLGEEERRSLVKVEKEAVLKKMKEQQKHSCSCTVCGRKRTAIEEELEVLYDAYYEELEQYANHQQINIDDGASIIPPPRAYHPMSRPPPRAPQAYNRQSSRGRIQEIGDEDDGGDEDEDSEDLGEEDDLSDDYEERQPEQLTPAATDFFNFGNSLTVQGGILTVADDLLKNDGKKFIEMMEQLAERRMQREEDAQYAAQGMPMSHSHASNLDQDLYDDEDDDEDYSDSGEYDDDEEEELEDSTMTEEQRMEEGRRMFQIFAARMFEQRVLSAYREKVSRERQLKLLEELEDESKIDAQREAKKAKEAQKKKDKKRQQKQAKDEEKAKRDAELAAQEAAAKALEEKKAEEQRQKREEQRKKREAEKRAQEEEKQKKEAEKQRRLQDAKEQQLEQERKQREQKERERKKKEDAKKKEREEREAKEKEAREKKEHEANDRREREAKARAGSKKEEPAVAKPPGSAPQSLPSRPSPATANSSTMGPPGFLPPHMNSIPNSPHLPIATPVVPKAPTPVRPRQPSFHDSRTTSPKTPIPPPFSSATSPSVLSSLHNGMTKNTIMPTKEPTPPQQSHAPARYSPQEISPGSMTRPPGFSNMPVHAGPGNSSTRPDLMQNAQHTIPIGQGYSTPMGPDSISYPPGMNGMRPPSLNNSSSGPFGDIGQQIPHRASAASHTHSRNTSTSSNVGGTQPAPIGRPAPIQRPSSVGPKEQSRNEIPTNQSMENRGHLGSSALLGDDTEDFPIDEPRRGSMAPLGGPQNARPTFGNPPGFPAPIGTNLPRGIHGGNPTWSNQQSPYGMAPSNPWPSPSFGRQSTGSGFGSIGSSGQQNSSTQRAIIVRTLFANSCQKLTARSPMGPMTGWNPVETVLRDVNISKPQHVSPVEQKELLSLCETAGNAQNGGGEFQVINDPNIGTLIQWQPSRQPSMASLPGDIGSPVGGHSGAMFGNQRPFGHGATGFPPSTGF